MSSSPQTFQEALQLLTIERPMLGITEIPPRVNLAQVAVSDELDAWLAATATLSEGMDPRTSAAYLVSILVWKLGEILSSAYLMGAPMSVMNARDISVDLTPRGEGRSRDIHFAFHLLNLCHGSSFDRQAFARSIVDIHQPLVNALRLKTGLGAQALWRLVADGFSGGLLAHGKVSGCVDVARTEARAILSTAPLHNRQWSFVEIKTTRSHWFRLRGGCCRLYVTPGGEYCTTCVLRSRESQTERLRAAAHALDS